MTVISGPPYPDLPQTVPLAGLPSMNLFETDNALMALRPRNLLSRADRHEWLSHNTGAFGEMRAYAYRLRSWIKENRDQFDIIHDNQTLADPMVDISGEIPLLTTLHHPIEIDRQFALAGADKWWKKILTSRWHNFVREQARAGRQLPRFICVSEASRKAYHELCGIDLDRISVSHNGLDHDSFHSHGSERRDSDLIVAMASADVPIKGLDVLIDAFALIKEDLPRARLEVIGTLRDGPTRRSLEASGLTDRVTFRSGLPREDVASLFRKAGVFVSASRFEGFGFPPAEAMACGAPVIVSDGGALPEIAGDAGLITPVGDPHALAGALKQVLTDKSLRDRLSKAGQKRATTCFRWEQHALDSIQLYKEMLGDTVSA